MNLKSKAISEIRATIETLNAHTEFADRIEGLQVLLGELEQPEWVSVTDRLPESDKSVLCYNGNHQVIGYYSYYSHQWEESKTTKKLEWQPTHWKPLSQPPTK